MPSSEGENKKPNGPPSPPPLRPQLSQLLRIRDDELDEDEAQPSPPYQASAFPSSSRHHLPLPDSPAYRSTEFASSALMAATDDKKQPPAEEEDGLHLQVHYPDELGKGPAPSYKALAPDRPDRQDSTGMYTVTSSKAPSLAGTDDEYGEDDDYDWSGEEDLVDQEARFEEQMGTRKKVRKGLGPKRIVTFLFSTLLGSIFLAGLLVAGPILLHFFWYKPHRSTHRRFVLDQVEAWLFWAAANLLVSWFLGLLIDLVPVVVRFAIAAFWGHVSEYVKNRLELYNSVKDTLKPVTYAASGWVSWVILFQHIYKLYDPDGKSKAHYTPRVYQVIEFLFFFALVISMAKLISHFVAFAFHRTAYKERLDSLKEALKVIEILRNHRPKRASGMPKTHSGHQTPVFGLFTPFGDSHKGKERPKSGTWEGSRTPTPVAFRETGSPVIDDRSPPKGYDVKGKKPVPSRANSGAQLLSDVGHANTSATHSRAPSPSPLGAHTYPPNSPRRSHESDEVVTKAAKALRAAVLHDARNIKGKAAHAGGALGFDLSSPYEAKRLAKAIYSAFKSHGRKYLLPADFYPAFKTAAEAEAGFRVFDKDNNGDISRAEIKTTLLKVYKERRSLSRSMHDVSVALRTLDHIIIAFALVMLGLISLSVFEVNVGTSLSSLYTIGLGASFAFKTSAQNAFDAIMFLFVTHPFDTGDRVFVDDQNLVVKKMGLFATVFTRSDGSETYYFNSQLFAKFIMNMRRSANTAENLTMQLAWDTPLSKLDALEKELNEWLSSEENRWFTPPTSVTLQHIDYMRSLEVTIGIGHNSNWQDWGLKNQRRTAFHAAVQHYARQLGIVCRPSTQPVAWVDPETGSVAPPLSPGAASSINNGNGSGIGQEPASPRSAVEYETKDFTKPLLGFLPPQDERVGLRVRKSKGRKAVLRSMGASMADGGF